MIRKFWTPRAICRTKTWSKKSAKNSPRLIKNNFLLPKVRGGERGGCPCNLPTAKRLNLSVEPFLVGTQSPMLMFNVADLQNHRLGCIILITISCLNPQVNPWAWHKNQYE